MVVVTTELQLAVGAGGRKGHTSCRVSVTGTPLRSPCRVGRDEFGAGQSRMFSVCQVFLVRKVTGSDAGQLYAMKVLRKATLKGKASGRRLERAIALVTQKARTLLALGSEHGRPWCTVSRWTFPGV